MTDLSLEDQITQFLNGYTNDNSRTFYKNSIKKVKHLLYKPENEIVNEIEKLEKKTQKQSAYKSISAFYTKYGIPNKFLRDKMDKLKNQVETENSNQVLKHDDLNDLKIKFNEINDDLVQDKLILYFMLYEAVLRSDLASVKIRNVDKENDNYIDFENQKIVYNHLVKNDKKHIVKLSDIAFSYIQRAVMKNNTDYLITFKNRDSNVSNCFVKKIQTISLRHLKVKLSINDFRKIYANANVDKTLPIKQQMLQISKNAEQMNNGISSQISYYIKKTPEKYTIIKLNGKLFKLYGRLEEVENEEPEL